MYGVELPCSSHRSRQPLTGGQVMENLSMCHTCSVIIPEETCSVDYLEMSRSYRQQCLSLEMKAARSSGHGMDSQAEKNGAPVL